MLLYGLYKSYKHPIHRGLQTFNTQLNSKILSEKILLKCILTYYSTWSGEEEPISCLSIYKPNGTSSYVGTGNNNNIRDSIYEGLLTLNSNNPIVTNRLIDFDKYFILTTLDYDYTWSFSLGFKDNTSVIASFQDKSSAHWADLFGIGILAFSAGWNDSFGNIYAGQTVTFEIKSYSLITS